MMDILAASYTNIGPFYDRTISLVFHKGKYVINAPVGSGKSFLFFDGPLFSLYKHAVRPIRNRRSKKGEAQLLFSRHDDIWLVVRAIGSTKSGGDSVKTKLFKYIGDSTQVEKELDTHETFSDISWHSLFHEKLEEVVCTNEKEVDVLLGDLLPPKEVVLSANFLMQDAVNVFEIAPAKRLEVFKHIFGFIGIDHAKDIVRDKRKEVQTRITVMQDMSDIERVFEKYMSETKNILEAIQSMSFDDKEIDAALREVEGMPFLQDLLFIDALPGLDSSPVMVDRNIVESTRSLMQEKQKQATLLQGKKEQLNTLVQTSQEEVDTLVKEYASLEKQFIEYKEETPKEKDMIITLEKQTKDIEKAVESIPVDRYIKILHDAGHAVHTFDECIRAIDALRSQGQQSKIALQSLEDKKKILEQQERQRKETMESLHKNKELLQGQYDDQMVFACDKIAGPCPYVEMIKGASVKALKIQQEKNEAQLADLEKIDRSTQKKELAAMIKKEEAHSEQLREILITLGWKTCMEDYEKRKNLKEEKNMIDKKIQGLNQQLLVVQESKKKYEELQVTKKLIQEQLEKKKSSHATLLRSIQDQEKTLGSYNTEYMERSVSCLDLLLQKDQDMSGCISQYKERKLQLQSLQEEQKRLKDLYSLFSKELMLLVLQDFLPSIEDMMNTYLDNVADYTVRFSLGDDVAEAISLDIFAEDQRGIRPVKSLSGGQKSLLKLARILSIASMMKLPFLFLDETITSLDASTTANVADVLHRFVQTHDITFYVVTHSTEVQQLSIRDKELIIPL